jgi:hypothetical protein
MKQETLEEAAERLSEKHHYAFGQQSEFYQLGFIEGAKWQSERMYSALYILRMYSDAIEFAEWIRIKDFQTATGNKWIGLNMEYYTTQELYEQFKKDNL